MRVRASPHAPTVARLDSSSCSRPGEHTRGPLTTAVACGPVHVCGGIAAAASRIQLSSRPPQGSRQRGAGVCWGGPSANRHPCSSAVPRAWACRRYKAAPAPAPPPWRAASPRLVLSIGTGVGPAGVEAHRHAPNVTSETPAATPGPPPPPAPSCAQPHQPPRPLAAPLKRRPWRTTPRARPSRRPSRRAR